MGGRFRRRVRGGEARFVARFAAGEVALLEHLATSLAAMLDDGETPQPAGAVDRNLLDELPGRSDRPVSRPEDPVLARLFPDGYGGPDEPDERESRAAKADITAEFRRLTEPDLRARKRADARSLLAALPQSGGVVSLDADTALAWLTALNDLRLALGTRLDVREDTYERTDELARDDPRAVGLGVYQWLTYVQDGLITALGDPDG